MISIERGPAVLSQYPVAECAETIPLMSQDDTADPPSRGDTLKDLE